MSGGVKSHTTPGQREGGQRAASLPPVHQTFYYTAPNGVGRPRLDHLTYKYILSYTTVE